MFAVNKQKFEFIGLHFPFESQQNLNEKFKQMSWNVKKKEFME